MAKDLIDVDAFSSPIRVPEGTDSRNNAAGDVELIAQRLANRTRYALSRVRKLAAVNLTYRNSGGALRLNAAAFGMPVATGEAAWIVAGETGKVLRSTDGGRTWGAISSGLGAAGELRSVAWGSDDQVFVIAGAETVLLSSAPQLYSSNDGGLTWVLRTPGGTPAGPLYSVAYGAGLFAAVGLNGEIQTSPDGITWTKRSAGVGTSDLYSVTYAAGVGFVAVGQNAAGTRAVSEVSADGITWTNHLFPAAAAWASCVASDPAGIVAGVQTGADGYVYVSADGVAWVEAFASGGDGYALPQCCAAMGGLFVLGTPEVFSDVSALIVGSIGGEWTVVPAVYSEQVYGIATDGYKFLITGHAGVIADSLVMP